MESALLEEGEKEVLLWQVLIGFGLEVSYLVGAGGQEELLSPLLHKKAGKREQ